MNPFLAKKPFDATPLGILKNTITGIPSAALKVGKEIGQSVARSAASTALTIARPLGGVDELSASDISSPFGQELYRSFFGSEPVKPIEDRIAQAELVIKASPFAKKVGLDKAALPLAFGGIFGLTALDLTPFGGLEKNAAKSLLKETSEEGVSKILKVMQVPDEVTAKFAPHFAEAKTAEAVQDILDNLKGVVGMRQNAITSDFKQVIADNVSRELSNFVHTAPQASEKIDFENIEQLYKLKDVVSKRALTNPEIQEAVGLLRRNGIETIPNVSSKSTPPVARLDRKYSQSESSAIRAQTLESGIKGQKLGSPLPNQEGRLSSQAGGASGLPPNIGAGVSSSNDTPAFDPVKRLIQALKEAKPIRGRQEKLYSKERAQRVARVASMQQKTSGESGFYRELGQLKGELSKVNYESIRKEFSQPDIDALFNMVKDSPRLDLFEQITARGALVKMLGGEGGAVPTVGELKLLSQVFPKEMIDALLAQRPFAARFWDGLKNALNVPRSIMSSFDLSAPLRQGIFLVGRKEFYPAFAKMFKQFGSEKAFKAMQEEIASRPTFKLMKKSRLALTEMDRFLSDREEAFMSNWAEKIPVVGRVVRASGRAYVGFLNKLRADTFDSLVKQAKDIGVDFEENEKVLMDLSKFINSATGRGDLGSLNRAVPIMNGIFFSPRLMASRLNLLNPLYYVQLDPFVRKQALKSLLSFGGIAATVLTLAKMGGANVGADPTSADFGKVRIDYTRYDVLGGFQQYIKLAAQLITGKVTSTTTGKVITLGEGYRPLTRKEIIIRFFQNKENPVASFVTDFLDGQDVVGNKFDLSSELVDRFIPLILQDLKETVKEWGPIGVALEIPAVFGVGTQTYGGPNSSPKKGAANNPFLK